MLTKKGYAIRMSNGANLLVDDIQVINDQEYIVFFSAEAKTFLIATEEVVNGAPKYHFLSKEESIAIAEEIDKLKKQ